MRDKPAVRKKRENGENDAAQCPACDAPLKIASGKLRHKVQCPRCRATVEPVAAGEEGELHGAPQCAVTDNDRRLERQEAQIRELEDRVKALERVIEKLSAEPAKEETPEEAEPKVRWLPNETANDYSAAHAEILSHNLRAIHTPPLITIQCVPGSESARVRANWFAKVFADANWDVRGPEDTNDERLLSFEISLVTSLPVAPESAATFLAIRAAGFEVNAIYRTESEVLGDRLVFA